MKRKLKLKDYLDLFEVFEDGDNEITCSDNVIDSEFYFYKKSELSSNWGLFIECLKNSLNILSINSVGITVDLYELLDNQICIEYAKKNFFESHQYNSNEDVVELLFEDIVQGIGGNVPDSLVGKFLEMLNDRNSYLTHESEDYLAYQRINDKNILDDLVMKMEEIVNGDDAEDTIKTYLISESILYKYVKDVIKSLSDNDLYNEIYMSTIESFLNKAYKENPIQENSIGIYNSHNADTELNSYSGKKITILSKLTEKECDIDEVGNMYHIRFEDGFETDAFEDEITLQEVSELC